MADENQQQAVIEGTDGQAKPAPEGTDAQGQDDDWETLLAPYEQYEESKSQPEQPQTDQAVDQAMESDSPTAKRLEQLEMQVAKDQFLREIEPVIKEVRGDLSSDVLDDQEFLDLLEGRAKRDPRLSNAWTNRPNDPNSWKKIVNKLAQEYRKKFDKLPDVNATEDREAVTAAVRGASKQAPESEDIDSAAVAKMSDAEFEAWTKAEAKKLGF